jgi:hypothetical protein
MKNKQTTTNGWNVQLNFSAIIGIILCLFAAQSFATFQESDKIILNGAEYRLLSNPMEPYFVKFPEKRPPHGGCSGNWSGYHAIFEISKNKLWLVDIQSRTGCDGGPSILSNYLDGKNDKLKADWYTGLLVVPNGGMVGYPVGFGEYEKYILIEIEKGKYIREFELTLEHYNLLQSALRRANERPYLYERILNELTDAGMPRAALDYFTQMRSVPGCELTTDTRWYTANPKALSFTISTAEELAGLAQIVNGIWGGLPLIDNFHGKTVTLANDIDLSSYDNWIPVGDYDYDSRTKTNAAFAGTFDGNGYIIRNLTINRPAAQYQGLFGYIKGAAVKNLGVEEVNIRSDGRTGGVAGTLDSASSVANCYSIGTINSGYAVGGVAGYVNNGSYINNSYSGGTVSGGQDVGGVAGTLRDSSIVANSYFTGTINGGLQTGGVVGFAINYTGIANCYSSGTVSGDRNVGGVVGWLNGLSKMTNSYSAATVSGSLYIGGVAGGTDESDVIDCAALNHEVKSYGNGIVTLGARVIGNGKRITAFANNAAWDGMKNNDGTTEWLDKGADKPDGADITTAEIKADPTIGSRFTAGNGWTTVNGLRIELGGEMVLLPVLDPNFTEISNLNPASTSRQPLTAYGQFVKVTGRTLNLRFTDKGNISIFSLNGAKVRAIDLGKGSHTLRLNDLPTGMYVVRAKSGAWKQSARILVK